MSYDKWIVVKNSKTIFGRNMSTKVHQEIGLIFSEKKKKNTRFSENTISAEFETT